MATRREFLVVLGAGAIARPLTAFGQQQPIKTARIGWLTYLAAPDPALSLLREGMGELGYIEGKSYVIVGRYANDDFTRLPSLVEELAAERVDVIVSRGAIAAFTIPIPSRIPVVFAISGDPVERGGSPTVCASLGEI